ELLADRQYFLERLAGDETLRELLCDGRSLHPSAQALMPGEEQEELPHRPYASGRLSRACGSRASPSSRGICGDSSAPPTPSSFMRRSDGSTRASQDPAERL